MTFTTPEILLIIAAVGAQTVLIIAALRPKLSTIEGHVNSKSEAMAAEIRALRKEIEQLHADKFERKETAAVLAAQTTTTTKETL